MEYILYVVKVYSREYKCLNSGSYISLNMVKVKFTAKKTKLGNSFFVLVPKGIADILLPDQEYEFIINGNAAKKEEPKKEVNPNESNNNPPA